MPKKRLKLTAFLAAVLSCLLLSVSSATAGTTNLKSNVRIAGNLTVTGTTAQTGAVTFTASPTFPSTGIKINDSASTHTITLLTATDEAANRTLTIPALGGNADFVVTAGAQTIAGVKTFSSAPVLSTATVTASGDTYTIPDVGNASFVMTAGSQTIAGATTFTLAPVLTSATLSANGDTITIQDLGNANIVQSEGAQTINGVKTFGSAPVITGGLPASQIQTGSAKRQVQTVMLTPPTGAAADATVYRGIISFKRAGTVTGISYGAAVVPTSGTNVIAVEKNSFSGNTMLNAASVSLNSATIGQSATLTATGADLALTAEQVITCEYNAGTQDVDAEQVFVTVEFEPTDF